MDSDKRQPADGLEKSATSSRRRILKTILVAGGGAAVVPKTWVKPAVDAVVLPLHAQASCPTDVLEFSGEISWNDADGDEVCMTISAGLGDGAGGCALADDSTGDFEGTLSSTGGTCPGGGAFTQSGTFSGNLNTSTGVLNDDAATLELTSIEQQCCNLAPAPV
jgi:hypothetical protein